MNEHSQTREELLRQQASDPQMGLTEDEAQKTSSEVRGEPA